MPADRAALAGRSPRAPRREPGALAIRREVIEFAQLPISSWLPAIDSVSAVLFLVQTLSEAGQTQRDGRCEALCPCRLQACTPCTWPDGTGALCAGFIGAAELAKCLEVPVLHAQVQPRPGAARRLRPAGPLPC